MACVSLDERTQSKSDQKVEQTRDWAFDKLKGQGDKWTDRIKEVRQAF